MKKFRVTIWFKNKTVVLSAKDARDAKRKAYKKFDKIKASRFIERSLTDIEE